MLEKNPVAWLEGRDRLQERILWSGFLLAAIYCALMHLHAPDKWPTEDSLVAWPWWAHCILCFWLVIQAPRRIADDKYSGALELLLCTPLPPGQIVRGNMVALRRRYGRVLIGLLLLDGFILFSYFSGHDGWRGLLRHDSFQIFVWGLVVFPIQLYSLARISLYQALVQPNSLRASYAAVWRVGLLPWVIFFIAVLTCDFYFTRSRRSGITETVAFALWGTCHLLPCAAFVGRANFGLKHRFRALAGASDRRSPWQRLKVALSFWKPRPR